MAESKPSVVVVGAGFAGLGAAYELARRGCAVTVLEADGDIGGLAGSFRVNSASLEKFYHHWFTSDQAVMDTVHELGLDAQIVYRSTPTGLYFANRRYRLSTPIDVLRFTPLGWLDRIRLGLLMVHARRYGDWRQLDHISAADWIRQHAGSEVYRVVWEPLMKGKFGEFAESVSAAWFWSKLIIRGGSRGKGGGESLAYFRGGFTALAQAIADDIRAHGGEIRTECPALALDVDHSRVAGVRTGAGTIPCRAVILTTPLPIAADLLAPHAPTDYISRLRSVRFLANVCQVLVLERSLSNLYWTNVNDAKFPFVGIIEHTNFEPPESYGGRHIVYLSKYLFESADLWRMDDRALLQFSLPHIRRMFPEFDDKWIVGHHVWRAAYAQPLVEVGYSEKIPPVETPLDNAFLVTMAQVYPEDRGTNYALRDGRRMGERIAAQFGRG